MPHMAMVMLIVMKDSDDEKIAVSNDDGGTGGWSEAHINDQIPIVCLPTTTIH